MSPASRAKPRPRQRIKVVERKPPPPVEIVLEELILRHLEHLRLRGLRRSTIYNRTRALARLTAYLDGPILYATEEQLRRWQLARTDEITPAARGIELSHAREFYRWAHRERLIQEDPTVRLAMPRQPRRVPRPMTEGTLAHAMLAAEPETAAIIGLAAFAGLRAIEIAQLDWSEVSLTDDPPMLRIVDGKGGHGRLVPIAPALLDLLDALPGTRRGPVIRRIDGGAGPNEPHRISARANTFLHSVGIPETLHQARHRFATATYRACRDIRAVQDLLGHRSPLTTAGYASASPDVGWEAVRAAGEVGALAGLPGRAAVEDHDMQAAVMGLSG